MEREKYIEEKRAAAAEAFKAGCNCCQAVLTAFAEELELDKQFLIKLGSGFGAGLARLREVCGTVAAMGMAEGLLSSSGEADKADKDAVYKRVRILTDAFRARNGSIICRELLAGVPVTEGTISEERTQTYFKRPCAEYCADAAEFLALRLLDEPCASEALTTDGK